MESSLNKYETHLFKQVKIIHKYEIILIHSKWNIQISGSFQSGHPTFFVHKNHS